MKKLIPLFFLSFVLLLNACSNESESKKTETVESSRERTIHVYGIDQLKFVVKEQSAGITTGDTLRINNENYYVLKGINAAPGETINLTLTTISRLPASAMSHNWLLLEQEADVQAFVTASSKAKANDYVAPGMGDQVIAETGLAGGGESESITFEAPDEAGDYEYLCTFPGHFSAGMKGVLTVEK